MGKSPFTVCGITEIDGKILLVRHTYGMAKDRILIPGGHVNENELPTHAVEREIFEETGVKAEAGDIFAIQFKTEQWCVVFEMRYISGEPRSDGYENSEVLLLSAEEAVLRNDITNLSREILQRYTENRCGLAMSDYVQASLSAKDYALYEAGRR